MKEKSVIVIGAGLGGLSAAISLAQKGFRVEIFEKNDKVGGKLNRLQEKGFTFDLGPSIFTLPQYFEPLFKSGDKNIHDYIKLVRVDPQWRNFFEDGTCIDLYEKREDMQNELNPFGEHSYEEYCEFLNYSREQYEVCERGYFSEGLDTIWDFARFYGIKGSSSFDLFHSMAQAIHKRVTNPYLRDIFEYFIKYVGSSAYGAPAFMNLMPHIQMGFGLWYVQGGMYELAQALSKRLGELNIKCYFNAEVKEILINEKKACGVKVSVDGKISDFHSDFVVSNMEIIPAHEKLLNTSSDFLKKFEPACSGIVIHLGTNKIFPQLAHHNFFYAQDQAHHFDRVFKEGRLPNDPTLYVVAPTRSDPSQAPPNCDNIKILPHIPHLGSKVPYTYEDCQMLKEIVLIKMERMGLKDLRKHIVVEDFWTPFDIEKKYYSNKGSIYGVVSDTWKNLALKAPKKSKKFKNLFFVGGSVNPGGGMPMVVLSGQHVARMISKECQC